MTKLQVGDSVRVRSPKPSWRHISPDFTTVMDKYVGQTFTVTSIVDSYSGGKIVRLEGGRNVANYQWRLEWLESPSNPVQNGDLL